MGLRLDCFSGKRRVWSDGRIGEGGKCLIVLVLNEFLIGVFQRRSSLIFRAHMDADSSSGHLRTSVFRVVEAARKSKGEVALLLRGRGKR